MNLQVIVGPDRAILCVSGNAAGLGVRQEGRADLWRPGRAGSRGPEDLLFILPEDIEAGQGSFLVVERTSDPSRNTYARALRRVDGSCAVEHRDDAGLCYGMTVPDMRTTHALLTRRAFPAGATRHLWSEIPR